jgi:hypothetical protein
MPCVGIYGIDMLGDKSGSGLPVFSKNRRNEFAFATVRGWFLAPRSLAGRTSIWRAHMVIVAK